jgi:tetratricopeptide (TPR) repeat protein
LCYLLPILLTLSVVPLSLFGLSSLPDFSLPEISISAGRSDSSADIEAAGKTNSAGDLRPRNEVGPGNEVRPGPDGDFFSATGDRLRSHTIMPRYIYLFTQFRVLVTYLRLLVLPVNQNIDHQYPFYDHFFALPVFLSFLLLTALVGWAAYLFRATRTVDTSPPLADSDTPASAPALPGVEPALRLVAFGILWFFITLAVESSFVPLPDVIMEHRLYLPGFGTSAVFATLLYLLVEKFSGPSIGRILFPVAIVLVLSLGFAAYQRNHVWRDHVSLWQDAVAKSPDRGRTNNNLGVALAKEGRTKEAIKAFSAAIEVDPYYFRAYYNLADLYLAEGRPELSLPLLQVYLQLKPEEKKGYVLYGASLMRSGRFPEVISFLEQNIDRIGRNAEAHFYLGSAYVFLGNRKAALRELNIVSSLDAKLAATLAGLLGRNSPHGFSNETR